MASGTVLAVQRENDDEVVWPAPGQVLFAAADGYDHAWVHGAGWYDYREGFLNGARALLNAAVEGDPVDGDRLAFPVVFLYRHYLELAMKAFIRDNAGYVAGASAEFEQNHDLPSLWKSCRQIIEGWWPGRNSAALNAIGRQIGQLAQIDPKSMAFRYPVDKKGRRSLPKQLQSFDLTHFADRIEAIGMWLDGADTGLYEEASWRAEMAAEHELETAELRAEMMADHQDDAADW